MLNTITEEPLPVTTNLEIPLIINNSLILEYQHDHIDHEHFEQPDQVTAPIPNIIRVSNRIRYKPRWMDDYVTHVNMSNKLTNVITQ